MTAGQCIVQPHVAVYVPLDVFTGVADDEVGGDRRAFGEGLVDHGFQDQPLGAALHAVAGDHAHGSGVLDAVGQAARRETGEDHAVHRTDAGAGQHRHSQLWHHGQIEGHAVALAHPTAFQHIGKAADAVVQLRVGDRHGAVCRVVGLPQDGGSVPMLGQVPVQTVGGDVELCALEPAHGRRFKLSGTHVAPRLHPVVMASDVGPKGLGVVGCTQAGSGHRFGRIEQKRHGHKLARLSGRPS